MCRSCKCTRMTGRINMWQKVAVAINSGSETTTHHKNYVHDLGFVVLGNGQFYPYPSGLPHWHWGNRAIAPVLVKWPWIIRENNSYESIGNYDLTGTKQSTTKPCHDDVIKWKHFPRYWPFVRGIHRLPVNSPHKAQWRGALMFSLICAWINAWVNNREAGDLRRHRTHCDVIVMYIFYGIYSKQVQRGWGKWPLGKLWSVICSLNFLPQIGILYNLIPMLPTKWGFTDMN